MTQAESIKGALIGGFYSRFTVGDGFDFHFDGFVLSSHEIASEDESFINSAFVDSYAPAKQTAISEIIAKSAVAAACLGSTISAVEVLPDSSLLLIFDNMVAIRLPTDTPTVDWHWAFTESGGDPYLGCFVGCFAPGDIQGSMPNNSFKPNPLRGSA
ncbi:hypothetical protein [Pseudoxanthomonas mexicana]|uniref:hypothetical protein n=1 Tax=Pseudoxanthomonas mexicana TaxID=128785 RepID=UPI00209F269C|nr:hypothetical protein [Pseudoxanthomonas mexicana]MCP1583778.1 hypothetical protein [Pseudoxanthomonas mexicana]